MSVDKNEFFREAVLRICRNLDIEIALQDCLSYLRDFMPADMFHLNIYDRGLGALRNVAMATPDKARKMNLVIPLSDAARRYIETQESKPVYIVDVDKARPLTDSMSRLKEMWPEHSIMVMHLAVKGFRPGNLALYAQGLDRFKEEHLELFTILKEPLTIALSNCLRYDEINRIKDTLTDDLQYLQHKLSRSMDEPLVGEHFGLKKVVDLVRGVAPLDSPVLLLGETGVGKEVVANTIHRWSRRSKGPFIQVNCGAIPETLIDSELFGHEKGAFTGAVARKRGYFERACGGTIFLDEVAELPLQAQVRMLRVLQEKKVTRIGGGDLIDVDIRIIAATHQDLEAMVLKKLFRSDLHYRLNVFPITIPPLRQRKEDIPALVHYFIAKKARELQIQNSPEIMPGAMASLNSYDWPGNVRELENIVERAMILKRNSPLSFDDIVWPQHADDAKAPELDAASFPSMDDIASDHIRNALSLCHGRIYGPYGAAGLLKINPNTLRHRMRKLGIVAKRKKPV
jgi:transcriptional regulator with GAF, ATPase, and Fis domain